MADKNTHQTNPHFGLKLAVLSVAIALLTAIVISSFYTYRTKEITLQNTANTLAWQTRLLVPSFKNEFMMMQNDAYIFSHFPAIRDYASFEKFKEEYLNRRRTPDQLRLIIATYFKTMIEMRPHYTQVQFIGIKNNGHELIRVNKTENGSVLLEDHQLQDKSTEPYFKDSLSLKSGETYFSIVSLNREHGKIADKRVVTIRHTVPIFDREGELFGMVVINADYEQLLQASLNRIKNEGTIFIGNDAGDYTISKDNGRFRPIQFHEDKDYVATPLAKKIQSLGHHSEASFIETVNGVEQVAYFVKLPFDEFSANSGGRYIGITLLKPVSDFLEPQERAMQESIALAFLMICLSPFLAWPLAKGMHRHFEDLWTKLSLSKAAEKKALIELKAIIEYAEAGLMKIDKQGIIQRANPASEKIFGYPLNELIGQDVKKLMPQLCDIYHELHDSHMLGKVQEMEGRKKSGESFAIDISLSEVDTGESIFYSAIVRDISERKKAENLLRETNRALIKSNAELDDFAYIASHDLKEPLRAIYNHTRFMMEDHGDELPEGAKTRMNRLLDVSLRMDKLIDDLLNFSRLSRNDMSRESFDMNALIQDAIDNIQPFIEEKNGHIIVEPNLGSVVCDRVRIVSVIQNLIVNALKYNDNAEKMIKIGLKGMHMHNGLEQQNVFYVEDNGIGIDERYKDSAFRIFKRLHNPKVYGDGTGSGLTFAKKNIERHGGSIWFEPVPSGGTIFYFTLKEGKNV